MKTAYLDCFAGASGNMLIGAFLDAGVPLPELEKELAKLGLEDEYVLITERVKKQGITALYFDVQLRNQNAPHHHDHHHHNHHHHDHHHHRQTAENYRAESPRHRNYAEIKSLLESSPLLPQVRSLALRILRRLGEAEAKVHGCSLEEVHFHEVGAVDTIIDLVGISFCLHYLGIEKVCSSPLHTGSGMIDCAHGRMPIPAPATAELLRGAAFYSTGVKGELLTPTGAAVITELTAEFGPCPALKLQKVAYGAGTWDLEIPNVLRVFIGESLEEPAPEKTASGETVTVIETTIDDMNPELYGHLMDKLFKAGALDVFYTPVYMKKNRPGILVNITCETARRQQISDVLFSETTTLGLRLRLDERLKLSREYREVETGYGPVRIKLGLKGNDIINLSPEYEDCRLLAEKKGVPLKIIFEEAMALAVKEILPPHRQKSG